MATQPSACTAVHTNPSMDDKTKRLSLAIVLAPQAAPCIDGKARQMSLLTAAAFAKMLFPRMRRDIFTRRVHRTHAPAHDRPAPADRAIQTAARPRKRARVVRKR